MTYLIRGSNVTDTVTLTVAAYIGNKEVAVDEISLVNVVDGNLVHLELQGEMAVLLMSIQHGLIMQQEQMDLVLIAQSINSILVFIQTLNQTIAQTLKNTSGLK